MLHVCWYARNHWMPQAHACALWEKPFAHFCIIYISAPSKSISWCYKLPRGRQQGMRHFRAYMERQTFLTRPCYVSSTLLSSVFELPCVLDSMFWMRLWILEHETPASPLAAATRLLPSLAPGVTELHCTLAMMNQDGCILVILHHVSSNSIETMRKMSLPLHSQ